MRLSDWGGSPLAATLGIALAATALAVPKESVPPAGGDPARSRAAFAEIAQVLRHPRCIACHTVTDFPRQGTELRPHDMNVRRGADNHGVTAMRCASCHTDANQDSGVPGAPHWALAPLSMGWEGLDDHQLAEALKDRAKNGNRSLEDTLRHFAEDPLVGWAWQPGGDRQPPPISRQELVRLLREWIDTGAYGGQP
ncbi:MAG TPA: hypothetical protein VF017_10690 [Thermoanaerobaculia bacterium]|nr:hypothetical protein [Thermoanaerobaculia bacterium]